MADDLAIAKRVESESMNLYRQLEEMFHFVANAHCRRGSEYLCRREESLKIFKRIDPEKWSPTIL